MLAITPAILAYELHQRLASQYKVVRSQRLSIQEVASLARVRVVG